MVGEVFLGTFFSVHFGDLLVDLIDVLEVTVQDVSLDFLEAIDDLLCVSLSSFATDLCISSAVDEDKASSDGLLLIFNGIWDLTDKVTLPC